MPDWLTHSLIGWITGKTIKLDVSLVALGSLIPDITKISLLFDWVLGKGFDNFFIPFHTPVGALLIGGLIALFFDDVKKTFLFLGVGIITHIIFDMLLLNVSGGFLLLFPFSWNQFHQLGLIRSDDYWMTIVAIIVAAFVYIIYFYYNKRRLQQYKNV